MGEALPDLPPVVEQDVDPAEVVERQRLALPVADPPFDRQGVPQELGARLPLAHPAVGIAHGGQGLRLLPRFACGDEEFSGRRELVQGLLGISKGLVEIPEAGTGVRLPAPVPHRPLWAPSSVPRLHPAWRDDDAGVFRRAQRLQIGHAEIHEDQGLGRPLAQTPAQGESLAVERDGLAVLALGAVKQAEEAQRASCFVLPAQGAEEPQGLPCLVEIGAGLGQGVERAGLPLALAHGAKTGQGLAVGRRGEETLGGHPLAVAGRGGAQYRQPRLVFSSRLQGAGGEVLDLQPVLA